MKGTGAAITLGLRQNIAQFMLLVAVNALVGGTSARSARSCHCWLTRFSI